MGNYLNRGYSRQNVENLVKEINWAIEMYLYKDGLKYYSNLDNNGKDLLNLKTDLVELVVILRKNEYDFDKKTRDLFEIIFEDCNKTTAKTPFMDEFPLLTKIEELKGYFNI
jgi:hypothetical protein